MTPDWLAVVRAQHAYDDAWAAKWEQGIVRFLAAQASRWAPFTTAEIRLLRDRVYGESGSTDPEWALLTDELDAELQRRTQPPGAPCRSSRSAP